MGATYTRQSSSAIVDGGVIEASDINAEFDQVLAAFAVTSGHTHDGTAAEGGPITKLLGTAITIGDATAGTDIAVTFDGETADGVLTWMEDEDYFEFSDDLLLATTEKLQFRDTAIYINSSADGQLDLVADTEIQIAATTIDINGAVDISGALTLAGTTLAETISDTVGAMVTSNTESGITVAYDDADNTLDFTVGTLNQNTTGNAATATILETARTIGGTSFDGSANIAVALSATATALATARTIHGVSFDGTANIDLSEVISDTVGAMVTSNTESGITVAYDDADNTLDFTVGTLNQDTTGTAATVTGAAQTNITSLGTLTALTVDDVAVNGKVVTMTGSASDTAVFTAGTNGTLSIVTTDAAAAAANIQITADGTVDIDSAGVLTLDSGAAINIEPAAGSAILLDGTISVDAGVVTGATSITSTAFAGALTGNVTGNASGTAATVTTAAQSNITSLGTLTALTVDNMVHNGDAITMTPSTSDTVTMTAATNGAFSLVTVDAAAASANIQITADGTFEVDATTITLDSAGDINLEAAADVNIPANIGLTFGDDGEKIEGDGTNLTIASSANLILDSGAVLVLDGDNGIYFKDGGATYLTSEIASGAARFKSIISNYDMTFAGNDGGSTITALSLDMSNAGAATFNAAANVTQRAITSSSNAVAWDAIEKPNAVHITTENTTFSAPSNPVEGAFICVEINYNGSHTIAFNTVFEFAASTAPTFTSTDAKTDIMVFRYSGAVWQEVGRTLNLSEA